MRLTTLAHIAYGILTASSEWYLAFIMSLMFIMYQLNEELHIKDKAYRDMFEYMVGLSLGAAVKLVLAS